MSGELRERVAALPGGREALAKAARRQVRRSLSRRQRARLKAVRCIDVTGIWLCNHHGRLAAAALWKATGLW